MFYLFDHAPAYQLLVEYSNGLLPVDKWAETHLYEDMEQELIKRIEQEAASRGLKESTLVRMAANDGKLYTRLKSGGSITLKTLRKITEYLDAPAMESSVE